MKLRRLGGKAGAEELQAEKEFLGITGEHAHQLKVRSKTEKMTGGAHAGHVAAMLLAGADQETLAHQLEAADPYAEVSR